MDSCVAVSWRICSIQARETSRPDSDDTQLEIRVIQVATMKALRLSQTRNSFDSAAATSRIAPSRASAPRYTRANTTATTIEPIQPHAKVDTRVPPTRVAATAPAKKLAIGSA